MLERKSSIFLLKLRKSLINVGDFGYKRGSFDCKGFPKLNESSAITRLPVVPLPMVFFTKLLIRLGKLSRPSSNFDRGDSYICRLELGVVCASLISIYQTASGEVSA